MMIYLHRMVLRQIQVWTQCNHAVYIGIKNGYIVELGVKCEDVLLVASEEQEWRHITGEHFHPGHVQPGRHGRLGYGQRPGKTQR